MPNRVIRDSCKASETLDRLSDGAERMWWRLVTVADDFGRFEADPVLLLAACFPRRAGSWKPEKIRGWLEEMVAAGGVSLYDSGGKHYGYFTGWAKLGTRRNKHSKFPEPPEPASIPEQMPATADACAQLQADDRKCARGTRVEDRGVRGEDRGARIPAEKRRALRKPPENTPVTDRLCQAHNATESPPTGRSWDAWGKAEFVALSTAIKRLGEAEAERRWGIFLATTDPFYAGHLPTMFLRFLGKFVHPPANGDANGPRQQGNPPGTAPDTGRALEPGRFMRGATTVET